MTSNLDGIKKSVVKEAERVFFPEFLNRIDDMIVFSPLTKNEVKEIAKMHLKKLKKRMIEENKGIEIRDEAIDILIDSGYSLKYGARYLKRVIDDMIKIPITLHWKEGNYFKVGTGDGHIAITWEWRELPLDVSGMENFETMLS